MVNIKSIDKKRTDRFDDEEASQVSHLSHPEVDGDDDDDSNDEEAKAAFAAATSAASPSGGDASSVGTGVTTKGSSHVLAADGGTTYATLCGVKRSRVLIVFGILVVGGIVGGLAYYFTSRNEQQNFEAEVRVVWCWVCSIVRSFVSVSACRHSSPHTITRSFPFSLCCRTS